MPSPSGSIMYNENVVLNDSIKGRSIESIGLCSGYSAGQSENPRTTQYWQLPVLVQYGIAA